MHAKKLSHMHHEHVCAVFMYIYVVVFIKVLKFMLRVCIQTLIIRYWIAIRQFAFVCDDVALVWWIYATAQADTTRHKHLYLRHDDLHTLI